VKNGGVSKSYLGSKYFDPSLTEPIKKKNSTTCKSIKYIDGSLTFQNTTKAGIEE